jgi:hypothetical protein
MDDDPIEIGGLVFKLEFHESPFDKRNEGWCWMATAASGRWIFLHPVSGEQFYPDFWRNVVVPKEQAVALGNRLRNPPPRPLIHTPLY